MVAVRRYQYQDGGGESGTPPVSTISTANPNPRMVRFVAFPGPLATVVARGSPLLCLNRPDRGERELEGRIDQLCLTKRAATTPSLSSASVLAYSWRELLDGSKPRMRHHRHIVSVQCTARLASKSNCASPVRMEN